MKNIRTNAFIVFFCVILFFGCSVEPWHTDYQIDFSESECKEQYELWKNSKPKSYSFIYMVYAPISDGAYEWRGKVIVKENAGEVQFIRRNGEVIQKDSAYAQTVPKEEDDEYIASIDDLFEELLEQYNTYKPGFDNKMFWWAEYHVDYNEENHYPEKIDLSIRYERPASDLKNDGDDVYFHVIISDFTILE